jgi:hypothetical protein
MGGRLVELAYELGARVHQLGVGPDATYFALTCNEEVARALVEAGGSYRLYADGTSTRGGYLWAPGGRLEWDVSLPKLEEELESAVHEQEDDLEVVEELAEDRENLAA